MVTRIKEKLFKERETWEQNLFVSWLGTFMTGVGFSLVIPLMSLYIDTLGNYSTAQLNFWNGLTFSSTFLVTTLISPWQEKSADQKERKLTLLRTSLGMAIVISLMGCVTSVYQLVALRLLQRIFSGYVSNATASIATGTPKERNGRILGTLATSSITGTLLGPPLGGISTSTFGYRPTLFTTGIILFFIFSLSLFFVHEKFVPVKKENMVSAKQTFKDLKYPHVVIDMFVITTIIQAFGSSVSPIISLYIRQLLHGHGNVTLISGVITSTPGITTLIVAPRFGRLGDKIGSGRIPAIGLGFAILVYIPTAFVTSVWQLATLRFLIGISDACLLPTVQALITKYSPHQVAGRVFNYSQSFQATGNVVEPMTGSSVSSTFGHRGIFLSTFLLVLVNFLLIRHSTQEIHQQETAEEKAPGVSISSGHSPSHRQQA